MTHPPPNFTTLAATVVVDEWARQGLRHAVVAPGSRSAPLALALVADPRIRVTVAHDERSAAFLALGCGLSTGRAALALCTSGTAGAHFYPAVLEAEAASVPLIVVTADRPPELQDVGAPQTLDQVHLFGHHTRLTLHLPRPERSDAHLRWLRGRIGRAWEAAHGDPGPVHLNQCFDEPLAPVLVPGEVSEAVLAGPGARGRPDGSPWTRSLGPTATAGPPTPGIRPEGCGLVIAGPQAARFAPQLLTWATDHQVPVLLDVLSGFDVPNAAGDTEAHGPPCILHADVAMRDAALVDHLRPAWILEVGRTPTSKSLGQAVARWRPERFVLGPPSLRDDPHHLGGTYLRGARPELIEPGREGASYLRLWQEVDRAVAATVSALARGPLCWEGPLFVALGALARRVLLASSMPVRDGENFLPRQAATVANRGVNGIDGLVATATGVALSHPGGERTFAVLGDVASIHDLSSLTLLARARPELTLVVVNNDGGAIFSYLPVATAAEPAAFEELFTTPHGVRVAAVAEALSLPSRVLDLRTGKGDILALAEALHVEDGPLLVEILVDRATSLSHHRAFWQEAGAAARAVCSFQGA